MAKPGRNERLASLLEELGWSISRFAAEVNVFMSSNTGNAGVKLVPRSTVQDWVDKNRLPNEPFPSVIAQIFNDALGNNLTTEDLWPGRARSDPLWISACQGLELPFNTRGTTKLIVDWLANGGKNMEFDRRLFGAVSGGILTGPAWDYIDHLSDKKQDFCRFGDSHGRKITPSILTSVERTIRHLRSVDDEEGGADHTLAYVHRHFLTVAEYLRSASLPSDQTTKRLFSAWAQLSQLAGWLAYDANRHGAAQRYFVTGLHATHSAGDRDMGAHLLACMTYQSIYRNRLKDAIELADAAIEASENAHPATRSLVLSRSAFVQAALGNKFAFNTTIEKAYDAIEQADNRNDRPEWLYWYSRDELEVQEGHSLLTIAFSTDRRAVPLVHRAESLMSHKSGVDNADYPRDALWHVAWLARSYAKRGEVEKALEAGWLGLNRLETVASPRSMEVLKRLGEDFNKTRRYEGLIEVNEFNDRIREHALAG